MRIDAGVYTYNGEFFDYLSKGAGRSARQIIPLLTELLKIRSVLDVGCGYGAWLREWNNQGVTDFIGVDGVYIDDAKLLIPSKHFIRCDIGRPFALGRSFDLIQSLEVAEHIPESQADTFLQNLASHGDIIIFSAAVPGQGGEFHVNEQPYAFWRDKFADVGFRTFDCLRPVIHRDASIEPWYRYNTLIFARETGLGRVRSDLMKSEIPHYEVIPTYASIWWRSRNFILAHLPRRFVHKLAVLKHKLALRFR